jgi:DamX protein
MDIQVPIPAVSYPLITKERTQKLELLRHLIDNLARTIVICGPDGVGKTLLLNKFVKSTKESWLICWLNGESQLRFEKIQSILSEAITTHMPGLSFHSLDHAFSKLSGKETKIILIIDNAGNLEPGLIEEIIAYAEGRPVLRIILTLTHNELYLKNNTDPGIDNCYHIDLPTLSEKECGEFLEYLSTLPKPRVHFSGINEEMIAALYRETHGIPGSILAQLPNPDDYVKKDYSKMVLGIAVLSLVAFAVGTQWWSAKQSEAKEQQAELAKQVQKNQARTATASSQSVLPSPQKTEASSSQPPPIVSAKPVEQIASAPAVAGAVEVQPTVNHAQSQSAPPVTEAPPVDLANATDTGEVIDDTAPAAKPIDMANFQTETGKWLINQPLEHYTLQLMALADEQKIVEVLQRNQPLLQDLRYIKTKTRSGRDRFIIIYGSYETPEQALQDKTKLPQELHNTWLRKISAVQEEVNRITQDTKLPG